MAKRRYVQLIVVAIMVFVGTLFAPSPANAYSGQGAANYAETWWNSHNPNYMYLSGDDCTNFVSQALHSGGGFSYVGRLGSVTDDHLWWAAFVKNYFTWSHSFTVSQDLWNFLVWDNPGGTPEGYAHSWVAQSNKYTPASVVTGDVIFYDFTGDGVIDHASIQVGSGTDPNSHWGGNFVDQHTNNRQHAFWSLLPYNTQWQTTTVYFMHINAGNK